ncbi:type II toxin-antitoxin system RelE/ParE family toxin [Roseiconus lacunae]|uniref:type II toxin-antitoxin system RelE/ParE family toxin n=1 Tax=Roseiconus lacunae TaxID=2605694 RepID=UPI001E38384D|nr:type II toxin-antitoxin system RelE/ParE family toxin [Roseiconus lacunae]MCD0458136.1 type II toxin-antitoxin system RelE/ParE family toxin [Roseiconus lacunae]
MKRQLRIQPAAVDDLDRFAAYIANDSPDSALRFLDAAEATFSLLAEMPFIGVACDGFFKSPKTKGLRIWRIKGFPNHQILYRVSDEFVLIVRIIHAAEDKSNLT